MIVPAQKFCRTNKKTGHRAYVRSVVVPPTLPSVAVTGGYDGTLRAYRVSTLEPFDAVEAHARGVGVVAASPVAPLIASAGADGFVRLWRIDGGFRFAAELSIPDAGVNPIIESLCFFPDGRRLAVGIVGGALFVADSEDGRVRLVRDSFISINALKFSPCGRFLVVAADDCRVHLFRHDCHGGLTAVGATDSFDDHVDAIDFRPLPRGRFRMAATTHGNRIWLFDGGLPEDLRPRTAPVSLSALNAVLFLDEKTILAGGDDRALYAINADTLESRRVVDLGRDIDALALAGPDLVLAATTGGVFAVCVSESRVVASSQNQGALAAITASDGRLYAGFHDRPQVAIGHWEGDTGITSAVAEVTAPVSCSAPDRPLFGLANGDVARVTSEGAVEMIGTAPAEVEAVCAVGAAVVAVDRSGSVTLFGPGGRRIFPVTPDGSRLKAVAFSPIRAYGLAAGKNRRLYRLAPTPAGGEPRPFAVEASGPEICARTINAICFGPDHVVYLSSWDGKVHRVRMSADGCCYELLEPLSGHDHAVEGSALIDSSLVTTSYDGTVRVWKQDDSGSVAIPVSEMAIRRLIPAETPGAVLTAGYDGRVHEIDVRARVVRRSWLVAP